MAEPTVKNIFVSHVHEDDEILPGVKSLLESKGYSVRDGSINSAKPNNATNPEYIKSEILAPRIKWASTMIVLISPETHTSEYVNWEIEYAIKEGKKVVGIFVRGGMDSDIPEALELLGDGDICGWNSQSLANLIEGSPQPWVDSSGDKRPDQPMSHYTCG